METASHFKRYFGKNEKLPTLPGIAMKILEAVQRDEPDLSEIAGILANDPPLSGELLKVANSSLFSLPVKVTSVFHAVNMLGLNTVKNLALSFSLLKEFRKGVGHEFDYSGFWKDSLIAAMAAKRIAETIRPEFAEDAFFLGLLHDIGRLAMARCMPRQYCLVVKEAGLSGCTTNEDETQILGFDHMMVSEYLLSSWGLPEQFCLPVRHHHCPEKLETEDPEIRTLTQMLHVASLYVELERDPEKSFHLWQIDRAVKAYGFSDRMDTDAIGIEVHQQAQGVFPLFELQIAEEGGYTEMIERARSQLVHHSADLVAMVLEQQKRIEDLKDQARRDGMTRLANYQAFYEMLDREISRAQRYRLPLSLVLCDIDHFKWVNDRYGHVAGDYAIIEVAECLRDAIRRSDAIARYGGEEFAIILAETPLEGAMVAADRVRKTVADRPVIYNGTPIRLTISCGVAALRQGESLPAEDFVNRADAALYLAKEQGRNRCCSYRSERLEGGESRLQVVAGTGT